MPKSSWSSRVRASAQRRAHSAERRTAVATVSFSAGYGGHWSSCMTMSAPSSCWIAHVVLRRPEVLGAVEDRAERHAVVGDLHRVGEAEDLEAAGVGEDRAVPAHEGVEPAGVLDDVGARAQEQVVGVGEDGLRPELAQPRGQHPLDGRTRPDGHEQRGVDLAVGRVEHAATCRGARIRGDEVELSDSHGGDSTPAVASSSTRGHPSGRLGKLGEPDPSPRRRRR